MEFEVNIDKKYFIAIISITLILGGALFVMSTYANPDTGVGHSIDEIDWNLALYQCQNDGNNCGDGSEWIDVPRASGWGSWANPSMCNPGYLVCGVNVKVESLIDGDNTGLNDISILCCKIPVPLS